MQTLDNIFILFKQELQLGCLCFGGVNGQMTSAIRLLLLMTLFCTYHFLFILDVDIVVMEIMVSFESSKGSNVEFKKQYC